MIWKLGRKLVNLLASEILLKKYLKENGRRKIFVLQKEAPVIMPIFFNFFDLKTQEQRL